MTALLVLFLVIAIFLIMVFFSFLPVGRKTKSNTLYVVAALMLLFVPIICDIIDFQPDEDRFSKIEYQGALIFAVATGYVCITIACLLKYNVMKNENQELKKSLMEKVQKEASDLSDDQTEKKQILLNHEMEWFASKIRMFSEEEQKAILDSIIAFLKYDVYVSSKIDIKPKKECSNSDLMYYICSPCYNLGKNRQYIAQFMHTVFKSYFPYSVDSIYKKLPGQSKVKEKREKEESVK